MWQAYRDALKKHLRMPSWRAWFEENSEDLSKSLVELVAEITPELEAERQVGAGPSER